MNTEVITETVQANETTKTLLQLIIEEVCVGEEFALLKKTLEIYAEIENAH